MPESVNRTPLQAAWITFAEAVQSLLGPQPDDRPLDQYLEFRDRVMTLVRSESFVSSLTQTPRAPDDESLRSVDDALLLELLAFSRAADIARSAAQDEKERKTWLGRQLSRAGTTVGSVKDLLNTLPPLVKGGLTLLKELIDLFKGSGA